MTAAERTAEHGFYAKRRRVALIRELSPDCRCALCGGRRRPELLLVDHVQGRTWRVEDISQSARVARYWREFRAGVPMRALCRRCSSRLDGGRRYERTAQGERVAPRGSRARRVR